MIVTDDFATNLPQKIVKLGKSKGTHLLLFVNAVISMFVFESNYATIRFKVHIQTKALPYVEDKKTSMSYSNSLPKTMELLFLGVMGVLGSLLSFVILKNELIKNY